MTVLIILASAILFDIILNDGNAMANIFRAIGSIFHKPQPQPQQPQPISTESQKANFIQNLKDEIDDLYDDLSYEPSELQENVIREQIKYKQDLIEKLMND